MLELSDADLVRELTSTVGSAREARWILEESAGSPDPVAHARELASRRQGGEPLQYLFGHWSFRTLDVAVDRRALVPRPETEIVVEVALGVLEELALVRPLRAAVDLGTGSGVIACSLASELPGLLPAQSPRIIAVDASPLALELCSENVSRLGRDALPVEARLGDWFSGLPPELRGDIDLIVSNPPYLSAKEWETLDPVVRDHEPYEALVAGREGTECVGHLLAHAHEWLAPDGGLVVEIAPGQPERLEVAGHGFSWRVEVRPDLAHRPRVLVARR